MKKLFAILLTVLFSGYSIAQIKSLDPISLDKDWKDKIYRLAPEKTQAPVTKKHRVLVFSLFTGFEHWDIPHIDYVVKTLGDKTGAYEVIHSTDVKMFEKNTLREYDAVVLNNNCSIGPRRDLFFDALEGNNEMTDKEKEKKAQQLESNLLNYIKNGGGLFVAHGAIVMQNNSEEFSEMAGGSFDYHPPQQQIELKMVEKDHPLTEAFEGKTFTHIDEPYFFKNAYSKKNFRPMLYMEISKIQKLKHEPEDDISYVSWIKRYGKGRVFYCSPSHNAQSYENSRMLKYYLNGMQYVLGDLQCDDSPINQ